MCGSKMHGKDWSNRVLAVLLAGAVVACLGMAGYSDVQQEESELRMYCQQVEAFNASGGDYGWPDYNSLYDRECK